MQHSKDERINLGELKGHIVKKIGAERSKRYFYYLSRFLSQKLAKSEFDKACSRVLGRENLSLHNQLIRSILRNATVAKSPPPPPVHLTKPVANGQEQSAAGSLAPNHCNQNEPVCSNGVRKRKMRDGRVGSNGKVEHVLQLPGCREEDRRGGDHQRLGRYGCAADERDGEFLRPFAKPRMPCEEEQVANAAVRDDDDKNQEEQVRVTLSASPLVAPLGIQFCSASVSRRRRVPVLTSGDVMSFYDSGGLLPDTEMLRKRMENIAVTQGLEGVSTECANTLNTLLDVYLKKLVRSCIDLVGARSTNGREQGLDKQQSRNKVNGVQIQTPDRRKDEHSVSLLDFRTAMELNPQQLGEDWPTLLERISIRSFEEH